MTKTRPRACSGAGKQRGRRVSCVFSCVCSVVLVGVRARPDRKDAARAPRAAPPRACSFSAQALRGAARGPRGPPRAPGPPARAWPRMNQFYPKFYPNLRAF